MGSENGDDGREERIDRFLEALGVNIRRSALQSLRYSKNESLSIDELATQMDAPEEYEDDREALAGALRHRHIPALEKAGIVDFDETTNSVIYH